MCKCGNSSTNSNSDSSFFASESNQDSSVNYQPTAMNWLVKNAPLIAIAISIIAFLRR